MLFCCLLTPQNSLLNCSALGVFSLWRGNRHIQMIFWFLLQLPGPPAKLNQARRSPHAALFERQPLKAMWRKTTAWNFVNHWLHTGWCWDNWLLKYAQIRINLILMFWMQLRNWFASSPCPPTWAPCGVEQKFIHFLEMLQIYFLFREWV